MPHNNHFKKVYPAKFTPWSVVRITIWPEMGFIIVRLPHWAQPPLVHPAAKLSVSATGHYSQVEPVRHRNPWCVQPHLPYQMTGCWRGSRIFGVIVADAGRDRNRNHSVFADAVCRRSIVFPNEEIGHPAVAGGVAPVPGSTDPTGRRPQKGRVQ
ncbi:hypothetical protein MPH_04500 [Macrophomina phaseolina MS6]|uniref:Uncharacterized protein n=1 Tax=Macrophomina phaseolina (strain MS6) TaxID=1126212 RepID=K2SN71_MACPH|nr:hypothetical protein MPH_04500 [Macrophomina phaseolina MS6]